MGLERERRLAGAPEARELDGELGQQRADEHHVARPGQRTLVEQELTEARSGGASARLARVAVGRRTLLDEDTLPVALLAPAPRAGVTGSTLSTLSGPRTAFDEFRSRGLAEVLAALTSMPCSAGLVAATQWAASKATRAPLPSLTVRPAPPDPFGQAMWRTAERRAAMLYRHAVESGDVKTEDPAVELALARAGTGQPLPADVRRKMELALGSSLDRVRVHVDSVAADAARVLRARAFTIGEDIFFAAGAYEPETPAGQRLLVHELTHVVQAYQGRTKSSGPGIEVSNPDESLEREADAAADRIGDPSALQQAARNPFAAISTPATQGRVMREAAAPGRLAFDAPSTPVGKLGRVQAPKGVFLRVQPAPGAASPAAPIPFNGLVYVESRTTQAHANERWCRVIATEVGAAGFCEERYLAIDPPEPTAKLRRTKQGERLAVIAEEAYGPAKDEDNSRLYVQVLYLANRDRAGVKLDEVDLSFKDRVFRGGDEEETLKVYKGVKVIEGTSIWIPSQQFVERLKAEGAVTGGSTYMLNAWHKAKDFVNAVVDGVKYAAGFVIGLLEGAYNAIVDLFKGALDMVEAVLKVIWNLVTGNPGRIKDMLMGWVDKMKLAWAHRGQIADEFLKKWNAESMWDRGLFQGEVLGWVMMTILLILVTMGEGAPAAVSGIALRWPQLTKLLQTVDTLGDVTTYLGAAARAVKVPAQAAKYVASKTGKVTRTIEHAAGDLGEDAGRAGRKAEGIAERATTAKEGCFVAGTLVWTPRGACAIERLGVGMRVIATDVEMRHQAQHAVMQTFRHTVPVVIDLCIDRTLITASPEHPFYLVDRGWQPAGRLMVGDRLLTAENEEVVVDAVTLRTGSFSVFNVTVEALSTYHVSPLRVLVHNKPARLDLQAIFNSRRQGLFESIEELRKKAAEVRAAAKTNEQLAALKKLENDIATLERQTKAAKFESLPPGTDPGMPRFDSLDSAEQLESKLYKQMDDLEKSIKPKGGIPADRPALDTETVLANGTGKYIPTGKKFQGRTIYKDADGKFYYVDNLHKGAGSEIEVFSPNGEHLGTMSPVGVFNASGKVKGRMLKKEYR